MSNADNDFSFEYEYVPSRDVEERLAQAWEIILALILEDYENDIREAEILEAKPCSTQSA
jgi:hypothetical protein